MTTTLRPARWRALRHPLYRQWALGLALSVTGTWCQTVTVAAVVIQRAGNGLDLAVLTTCAALPALLLSLLGGSIADRSGRPVFVALHLCSAVLAVATGWALAGGGSLVVLALLVLAQGSVAAVELPCRHRLVPDLVARRDLPSAMAVQSVIQMGGRAVGAAVAAALLRASVPGAAGAVNAVSCLALALVVLRLPAEAFTATARPGAPKHTVLAGLRAVLADALTRTLLLMLVSVGALALTTEVLLPLTAQRLGDASLTGWLICAFAVGALMGTWVLAGRDQVCVLQLARWAAVLTGALLVLGLAHTTALAVAASVGCGWACGLFVTGMATALQSSAAPAVRGRVMALFVLAINGTTPVGDPLVGAAAAVGGLTLACQFAAFGAACAAVVGFRHAARQEGGR